MPLGLKVKPKPVARRRAAAQAESSEENPQPSTLVATPSLKPIKSVEPAPSAPIAPPSGRLDSLSSSAPKPPVGAVRGGAGSLKFKPKLVARKTKEERDAIAAKLEASATPAPYDYKSRGGRGGRGSRGGRGRGGRDEDRFKHAAATASGPFALGSVETGRRKVIAVERGTNFAKHRQSLGSSEAKIGKKSRMKSEGVTEPNYSSSEDSDDARMDIEFIGYLDEREKAEDKEGDQYMDEGDDRPWGAGAPLRIARSQHVELKSSVNTDSSSKTDKGLKKGKNKAEFETAVKIKDEPTDEGEDITLPDLPLAPSSLIAGPEPEVLSQQVKEEFELEEQDRLATLREMVGDSTDTKIDEDDIEMVSPSLSKLPAQDVDLQKKCGIKSPKKPGDAEIDNQIFCFQLPEILPQLMLPIKPEIKTETKIEPGENDVKATAPPPPSAPVSLKQQKLSAKAQQLLLESFPPSGIAGKLRIHKSGRITILWGSGSEEDGFIEFDVSRGSTMGFLQEAVIVKQDSPWGEQDVDENGKRKGAAFSLGQVKGKFVVSPDFSKLIRAGKLKKKVDKKGKGKMTDIIQVEA